MKGNITQIIGPVVDVRFEGELPAIYDALQLDNNGKLLTLEVAQHIGSKEVRCIAMDVTDGLQRGAEVTATGTAISVPVGEAVLGRMFNVTGDPIDNKPAPEAKRSVIHRDAPKFEDQSTETEILETGIKVIDLIAPFFERWKSRIIWRSRSRKNCYYPRAYQQYCITTWRLLYVCRCW